MATLTAAADVSNSPPRVLLTVAGASGASVTVQRVDGQGNVSEVRTANPAALAGGGWVGYDYEAPYNQAVSYRATAGTTVFTSASVTVAANASWLVHPGIPSLSVPLEVAVQPTISRPSSRGLYTVLGRAEAVARSDGQRKARTFDLTVRTFTAGDEDGIGAIVDDDSVLLLQVADGRVYRPLYAWVSVGDITETPMATYAEGWLEWTLPCVEAARPAGLLQSQRTWADVVAGYATWADVQTAYGSWRDLIIDNQGSASALVTADAITVVDNGDGTDTLTGSGVTDNGDGTLTLVLTSTGDVDNGDGTLTLV